MKFMKLFLIIIGLSIITNLSAQNQSENESLNDSEMTSIFNAAHASSSASYGSSVFFVNPKRAVDGSVYLFDNWENHAIIYATNQKKYSLYNINLNIKRNAFVSQVGKDSLFAFSFKNIEKFVINNRVFKNYYWNNDYRVYESIAEGKNLEVLKGFSLKYVEGSSNPMLNRANDKYVRDQNYYVKKGDEITSLRLNKSQMLKLLNLTAEQKKNVLTYVEDYKLSFKREEDLKKIIDFVNDHS